MLDLHQGVILIMDAHCGVKPDVKTNKQVSFIKATRGEKLAELLHLFCNCVFAIALLVRHDHLLEIVFN